MSSQNENAILKVLFLNRFVAACAHYWRNFTFPFFKL
jgi:hypothetical protein